MIAYHFLMMFNQRHDLRGGLSAGNSSPKTTHTYEERGSGKLTTDHSIEESDTVIGERNGRTQLGSLDVPYGQTARVHGLCRTTISVSEAHCAIGPCVCRERAPLPA